MWRNVSTRGFRSIEQHIQWRQHRLNEARQAFANMGRSWQHDTGYHQMQAQIDDQHINNLYQFIYSIKEVTPHGFVIRAPEELPAEAWQSKYDASKDAPYSSEQT